MVRNLPANAGDTGDTGGEGHGSPPQCSYLGGPWTAEPAGAGHS